MAGDIGLGRRIARRRHVLDLTQAELARKVGASERAVLNWETGRAYPKRHIGKLEAVLGISLNGDGAEDGMATIVEDVRAARGLSDRQKAAILHLLEQSSDSR